MGYGSGPVTLAVFAALFVLCWLPRASPRTA
jgi:hypothetical protein